jgi:hypothetical protein
MQLRKMVIRVREHRPARNGVALDSGPSREAGDLSGEIQASDAREQGDGGHLSHAATTLPQGPDGLPNHKQSNELAAGQPSTVRLDLTLANPTRSKEQ